MTQKTSVRLPFSEGPKIPFLFQTPAKRRICGPWWNAQSVLFLNQAATRPPRKPVCSGSTQVSVVSRTLVCPSRFRSFVCFLWHKAKRCKSRTVGPAPESSAPRHAPCSPISQPSLVHALSCQIFACGPRNLHQLSVRRRGSINLSSSSHPHSVPGYGRQLPILRVLTPHVQSAHVIQIPLASSAGNPLASLGAQSLGTCSARSQFTHTSRARHPAQAC